MRFQHLTAKGFLKKAFRSICCYYRHKQWVWKPCPGTWNSHSTTNTSKTAFCNKNLCTRGRSPKGVSDRSHCLCLEHFLHSPFPRKKEEILYLPFLPSFDLFSPSLCRVLLAQRRTTSLPLCLWHFTLSKQSPLRLYLIYFNHGLEQVFSDLWFPWLFPFPSLSAQCCIYLLLLSWAVSSFPWAFTIHC